jgi:hypothetical protein
MIKEVYNKYNIIDKIFIYLIIFIFLFADPSNKYLQYSNLAITFLYFLWNAAIRKVQFKFSTKGFLYFPFLLLVCWLYGVILGLYYGNDSIFINNVGILFFSAFYFLILTPLKLVDFFKIFFYCSIISIAAYFYTIPNLYNSLYTSYLNYVVGNRISYNLLGIFPFLLFPILVYNIFFNRSNYLLISSSIVNYILFFLLLFLAIFFVASKGIYLFIFGTFSFLYLTNFKKFKFVYYLVIFFSAFFLTDITNQITIFGNQDPSNENRYKQFDAVLSELSFLGKGWGAKYISSDLDRDELGYSIELSYFNLIHKIGVFSLIFFIFYFLIFLKIFKLLNSDIAELKEAGLLGLGLTCYLFISIGNPSLFAPIFVFLNCILLILINKSSSYDK